MVRCCLSDLDGIPSFCSLKELYLAYNDISDLSQVSMLDHLVILDLEGNNIEDIIQVQYLGLCSKLSVLTLEGNPVCLTPRPGATEDLGYNYRATVKDLIPQLSVLDDLPANDITPSACRQANEDWKTIKDLIKDSNLLEDDVTPGDRPPSRQRPATAKPSTGQRPRISQRPASAGGFGTSRGYNSPGNLCPGSSGSDESVLEEDASGLTHGVGQVICGNPIKALRARRQKLNLTSSSSSLIQECSHKSEECVEAKEVTNKNQENIFAELKAWRLEHSKRLEAIQKEREPQILKIVHCNDDESSLDGSSEEEFKESSYNDEVLSASPEPSGCTTSSPDFSAEIDATIVMSSNSLFCPSPSPPPRHNGPPGTRKTSELRARRLKIQQEKVQGPHNAAYEVAVSAGPLLADEEFHLLDPERVNMDMSAVKPKSCPEFGSRVFPNSAILRPASGPPEMRHRIHKAVLDRSSENLTNDHRPIIRSSAKSPESPSTQIGISPLRAKAAVQRLPNRPALRPPHSKTEII
ncbi:leucine-rich repeat-containing protein 56 isoform X2 [Polypterus senegalus]|nr:leucine-rich repeat-containing protein 56 isoform X2 [Polypterus senegalus]